MSLHIHKRIIHKEIPEGLSVGDETGVLQNAINDSSIIGTNLIIPKYIDDIHVFKIVVLAFR